MPSTCEATVFYDDAGEASARIYALAAPTVDGRLLTVDELAECRLECRVEGPKCRYSTTLPTRVKLMHRGVTNWGDLPAIMAEAYLPDPCPWSPELPFLYRVIGEVRYGERAIAEIDQTFGIRPINVVRNRIVLNRKTWVPRAVNRKAIIGETEIEHWRELATVMAVEEPSDDLLTMASETGTVVFAVIRSPNFSLNPILRNLSHFPAVALIQLNGRVDADSLSTTRNTLFMTDYSISSDANCRQVALHRVSGLEAFTNWPHSTHLPVIGFRTHTMRFPLADARSACDILQGELAGKCDAAGFYIGTDQ